MEVKQQNKEKQNFKWFIQVFIITFILSIVFSYISTNGVSSLDLIPAIIILILVISIGIFFDIIGVAVTVADENEFHAKATKKIEGSKDSIKLIRNAPKVANICADVIGSVAALTVGGKALGKNVANNNSTKIVHAVGIILNKFKK